MIHTKFLGSTRYVAALWKFVKSTGFSCFFPPGYSGERDQVTVQETLPEIVRPMYAERLTTIDSPRSHPDKVRLAINQTAEEVAAKFVEITKAYKSSVGYPTATPRLFISLNSG